MIPVLRKKYLHQETCLCLHPPQENLKQTTLTVKFRLDTHGFISEIRVFFKGLFCTTRNGMNYNSRLQVKFEIIFRLTQRRHNNIKLVVILST